MNPLQYMMSKAELFDATKSQIGKALTSHQQIAVSAKLASNQAAFLEWAETDAGRAAIRQLADAFTFEAPKAAPETAKTEVKP